MVLGNDGIPPVVINGVRRRIGVESDAFDRWTCAAATDRHMLIYQSHQICMRIACMPREFWCSRAYDRLVTAASIELDSVPASLADKAYLAIRDQLIMLDIQPGEPIDDEFLAKSLGMGRTPVREALKRLASDRLVVSYSRRG